EGRDLAGHEQALAAVNREDEVAARAEPSEPGELRRRPLTKAGALARVRLLVARLEQARQRRVRGPRQQTTVVEEILRFVERLEGAVRSQATLERAPLFKLFERHVSSTTVTGPSFTSSTSILAPKTPFSTGTPCPRNSAQKRSYRGSASSGGAASAKLGRFPFAVSALSVNWDTTRAAPAPS